jgi:hypothetical protein
MLYLVSDLIQAEVKVMLYLVSDLVQAEVKVMLYLVSVHQIKNYTK